MLGAEGAGKTCTVHSLLDKDFQSQQPPTVGTDTHEVDICNSFTADRICVYNWNATELKYHLEKISTHYNHEMKQEMTKALNKRSLQPDSQKQYNEISKSSGLEVMKRNVQIPDGHIRVVIYDLGGQEVYYKVHHLFLASRDIIFLTFNASVDLDEPVVSRYRYTMLHSKIYTRKNKYTTYQVIETTLHTIYSFSGKECVEGSLSPRNPTVIMVATHACDLGESRKRTIIQTLSERLPKKLQDHLPKK